MYFIGNNLEKIREKYEKLLENIRNSNTSLALPKNFRTDFDPKCGNPIKFFVKRKHVIIKMRLKDKSCILLSNSI